MRRLTIHLKRVDRIDGNIMNTLAFKVNNQREIDYLLGRYSKNTSKSYLSNIK